jgi:hypothetical protein
MGAEAPLVAPLVPTLVVPLEVVVSGERGAVVPAAPAVSALVPVEGAGTAPGDAAPEAPPLALPLMPESERMAEPDWVCANAAVEKAMSAAAVAM